MAKRGRPSKQVMKRRKELKKQRQRILGLGILFLIALGVVAYFLVVKQGF